MSEVIDKKVLKALNADTRQEIIKLLAKRPYTASELSKLLDKHVTTVSEHLTTLERSGLISKRDTTNKWVYYALSNKGEKIFSTSFSWVIIFSLSVISLFIGFQQLTTTPLIAESFADRAAVPESATHAIDTGLIIGIVFISLALAGFAYLLIRRLRRHSKTIPA